MRCPRCKSPEVIRIIYGLPADREEAMKAEREGKIKLGGCIVGEESPNFTCKSCGKEWLTLYLETKLASQGVLATSVDSLKQLGYVTSIHGNEIQAIKTRRILDPQRVGFIYEIISGYEILFSSTQCRYMQHILHSVALVYAFYRKPNAMRGFKSTRSTVLFASYNRT